MPKDWAALMLETVPLSGQRTKWRGFVGMTHISVIIPNYNREMLVRETIQNMLDQSLPPREVIVVDDGSTDRSVEVIRGFGPRVNLVRQKNAGPAAARNAGLAIATGDYVQFMDSDDLASRNKLEVQAAALERESADIAYGPRAIVRINGQSLEFGDHVLQCDAVPPSRTLLEWFLSGCSVLLQNCLFRRELLVRAGNLRTDIIIWEDFEYLVRILAQQPRIVFSAEGLLFYRANADAKLSDSGTTQARKDLNQAKCFLAVSELLKKHGVRLGLLRHGSIFASGRGSSGGRCA